MAISLAVFGYLIGAILGGNFASAMSVALIGLIIGAIYDLYRSR